MSENVIPANPQDGVSELAWDGSYTLTMTVTSNARSNGQATNSATAYLSRHGVPQSHQPIDFGVTGNARFTNGTRYFSVQTDVDGKATVFFTDNQPEDVAISGSFRNHLAFLTSSFRANGLDVSAQVWADHAPADGSSANQLFYHVYDSVTKQPIANAIIDFSVIIGQAQLATPIGTTTPDGTFLLSVFKSQPGSAAIGAQVRGYPSANNYTYLAFNERQARYSLSAEVFTRRPDGQILVTYTLIDLNTGLGVSGKRINIFCGTVESFNQRSGPTDQYGKVSISFWNTPNAINHMLAALEEDVTVNAPFILNFKTPLI